MSALEPRCLDCRDKGYVVSYWREKASPLKMSSHVPGGFLLSCSCVPTINLQCNTCGGKLRSAPRDVVADTSQDGERAMQREIMREAEAAGWNVGMHRSDVDFCPACAVAK
jgi:hypothetical protein